MVLYCLVRHYWSITRAHQWLHKHGFVWDSKVDVKPNFIRFHQFDPSKYRIKKIKPAVELVVGFKK